MTPLQRITELESEFEDYKKTMSIKISALKKELAGGSGSSISKPHVKRAVQKRREFLKRKTQQ